MRKDAKLFLIDLLAAPSPSGFEQPAMRVMEKRLRGVADEVRVDCHGNLIACLNPEAKLRVMLAGHCDEIGFLVTHIEDDGLIRFAAVGGWDTNIIPARRVWIHGRKGKRVTGVIGVLPIHLKENRDKPEKVKIHELSIDIGARTRKEAEKLVEVGDPVTTAAVYEELEGGMAASRGWDDKAGAFVVAEALKSCAEDKRKLKCALYAVGTVQEELGLRGARTSAYGVDPQVGIAVDVTFDSKSPGVDVRKTGKCEGGKGPVLHRGANINPVVGEGLIQTARKKKIPYQVTAEPRGTGTDANIIQLTRAGVAAGLIGVPCRYLHTPVEMCSLKDVDNAVKLLVEYIFTLDETMDFTPK
jgi:endoglucanase